MSTPRTDFMSGVRDVSPLLVGVLPFGAVTGLAMVGDGVPAVQAIAMSVIVFAGASQLAVADLFEKGAPVLVVIAAALVVNLRFMMYSATLAPKFREFTTGMKAALASVLVDMNFALSVTRLEEDEAIDPRWYYLGVSIPLWSVWQVGTVIGVAVGASAPSGLGLDFAVPLIFTALAINAVKDRSTGAAALAAGAIAVPGALLPLELGLIVAAIGGIGVGVAIDWRAT